MPFLDWTVIILPLLDWSVDRSELVLPVVDRSVLMLPLLDRSIAIFPFLDLSVLVLPVLLNWSLLTSSTTTVLDLCLLKRLNSNDMYSVHLVRIFDPPFPMTFDRVLILVLVLVLTD